MRYIVDIPQATRKDLAETLGSENPEAVAEERIEELQALMRMVDAERSKWMRVQETAKLFPTDLTEANGDIPTPMPPSPTPDPPDRSYKDLSEYPARLTKLFEAQPERTWRTSELIRALADTGFIDASDQNEPNRVTRTLKKLVEADVIVSGEKKGQYRYRLPDPTWSGTISFPPAPAVPNLEAGP
jgi:hypothetical protein